MNELAELGACDPVADVLAIPPRAPELREFKCVPCVSEIGDELEQAIKMARRVPATGTAGWKESIRSTWNVHLDALAGLLRTAVDRPSEGTIFTAVYNMVIAPGIVLGPLFEPPTDSAFDSEDSSVNAALRKLVQGQERKAFKLLASNGVATVNEETLQVIRELHPERSYDVVPPAASKFQLTIPKGEFAQRLFDDAAKGSISKDVFRVDPLSLLRHQGSQRWLLR